MFGRISERTLRIVRWALAVGWVVLIVSLFADPLSVRLTAPANGASPFRINRALSAATSPERYRCPTTEADGHVDWTPYAAGTCDPRCASVQGRCLIQRPYALGARFFWTMILPLVPMFLMVFGHEAWRRICPLSALMQVPRRLGIQRRETVTDPRTGKVERRVRLIEPGGFLGRYFWFVQFALLWLGLSFRLLFINSDRTSLAVFFIGVIVVSLLVGYLFGGKTWCQYLCPIAPVQKFYTEPRGLLEGKAHVGGGSLTQSSCRTIDAQGKEQSTCVACRSPCPDIDLERQYWRELETPGRRFFYYGYLGLVTGFYWYYKLYAGSWEYYFTGAWTHEESQWATLLAPGWYFDGVPVAMPKLFAAPLTLAGFILAAYVAGRVLERVYDRWRERTGRPLSVADLRHRLFAFFTLVTFNVFYGFAGRPNIALLPPSVRGVIDMLIVAVSTVWFVTRLERTSDHYERESLESGLRQQLVQLRLDAPRLFKGRSINHLRTDEVYALGRALPEVSASQGRAAYRETLRAAASARHGASAATRELLRSVRTQLKISDDEHAAVLAELGADVAQALEPKRAALEEAELRVDAYRAELESMLSPFMEAGTNLGEALREPTVQARVAALQESYAVSRRVHAEACRALLGSEGALIRRARELTRQLVRFDRLQATLERVDAAERPFANLLVRSLEQRRAGTAARVAAYLSALRDSEEAWSMARLLATSPKTAALVRHVGGSSGFGIAAVLEAAAPDAGSPVEELALEHALNEIAGTWEPSAQEIARTLAARTGAPSLGTVADVSVKVERMAELASSPLLEPLALETLAELAVASERLDFAAGKAFRTDGAVLLVVRGSAHVLDTQAGVTRGLVGVGQTLGELGALTGAQGDAAAVAAQTGVSVLSIPAETFRASLEGDVRAASSFLRLAAERLGEQSTGLASS